MTRLVKRHIQTGLAGNEEEARKRIAENDELNAKFLLQNKRSIKGLLILKNN